MKYWPGLVMLAIGAWLLYSALRKRTRVISHRRQAVADGRTTTIRTHPGLLAIAAIMQPLVLFALLIFGAMTVAIFVTTDLARDYTVVDLTGFLGLLAGYGTWFMINTTYRDIPVSR
jgi:xanthine/uracil/vitamin C permease (AzgA family)